MYVYLNSNSLFRATRIKTTTTTKYEKAKIREPLTRSLADSIIQPFRIHFEQMFVTHATLFLLVFFNGSQMLKCTLIDVFLFSNLSDFISFCTFRPK